MKSTYKGKEYNSIELDLINHQVKLLKLGLIDIRGYRNFEVINGRIVNVTTQGENTNKCYVTVVVD